MTTSFSVPLTQYEAPSSPSEAAAQAAPRLSIGAHIPAKITKTRVTAVAGNLAKAKKHLNTAYAGLFEMTKGRVRSDTGIVHELQAATNDVGEVVVADSSFAAAVAAVDAALYALKSL